jgi:hypothetical protein
MAASVVTEPWPGELEVAHVVGRELMETFFWPCVTVVLGGLVWKPRMWGRPRLRVAVSMWWWVWLGVMVWLLKWPGKGYLDGRHTLGMEVMLFGVLALALVAWRRPMVWWMGWWRRRPEAWGRLPRWMKWRKWPGLFCAGVGIVMLVPGVTELEVRPRVEKGCVLEAAKWISGETAGEVVVCDAERLVGYYSGHAYRQWFGRPGKEELEQLPRNSKLIVGLRYDGDEKPAEAVGPYRAIKEFWGEEGDEVMVLYAKPGEKILKGGGEAKLLEGVTRQR